MTRATQKKNAEVAATKAIKKTAMSRFSIYNYEFNELGTINLSWTDSPNTSTLGMGRVDQKEWAGGRSNH